jgi:hypothetical protein
MARRTNDDFNNLNKDDREAGTGLIVSYQSEEGGITLAVPGDDDAPYVIANGRASDDGVTGLVEEPNGEMQRIAVTELGHLWVKVSSIPTPTPTPVTKFVSQLAAGLTTPVVGIGTLQRVTISIYAGAGFLFILNGIDATGTPLYTPIPIPTTLPAYIDIEFDTVAGLLFTTGITVVVSTTAPAVTVDATATGTVTTSYT